MSKRRSVLALLGLVAGLAGAQPAPAELPVFAAEIRMGPAWDASKPPQAQQFFKEHSANLRRLREAGVLLVGARYADKGLVLLSAPSLAEARALLDPDPSFGAGVFVYELHPFNVFYAGQVPAARRPATPQ